MNSHRRWLRSPVAALAVALVAVLALGGASYSAPDNVHGAVYAWAEANPGKDVPVLVQTNGHSETVAQFIDASGGAVQRQFQIIPAVEADISSAFVSTLASHPDVNWISLDAPVLSTGKPVEDSGGGCTIKGKTDTDCDGMIDNYENLHVCLNPLVADANADPDTDGVTNIDEKKAGTDPCLADSGGGSTTPTIDTTNLATAYPFAVNAPDVWNATTSRIGRGVTVAVLDTGITNANKDFQDGKTSRVLVDVAVNPGSTNFDDGYGHGTHVAGIVGGDGDLLCRKNCGKYIGIAPGASFADVKLSDDNGHATLGDVIAGLEFVYNNKVTLDIRVVNLSLRSSVAESYTTSALDAAVEQLWLNGTVVVVSAGNLGSAPDAVYYPPANDPFVIVVGAFDDIATIDKADDALASWSSRGTTQDGFAKPDIVAPGRRIISDVDTSSYLTTTYAEYIVDKHYFRMGGTSMAAPAVSGIVALMLEEHPEWTPGEVKFVLQNTARNITGDTFSAGGPLADQAVFFSGTPGDTDVGLTPSSADITFSGDVEFDATKSTAITWDFLVEN